MPALDVVKTGAVRNVKHQDYPVGTSVIRRHNVCKTVLTGSIPELQLHLLAI